jgi:predicted RecB family nuclease
MLYDLVMCPHRVTMDLFGDPAQREAPNPFLELLWEKGTNHEEATIATLSAPFVDLSSVSVAERELRTEEAMERREPLIYRGRIASGDLLGEPDLLRLEGDRYLPGDIKAASAEEGEEDDRRPKKHYGVQLALYVDILEQKGRSAGRRSFIWDVHGQEVPYDLVAPLGPRTPSLWVQYEECLATARTIAASRESTVPAYAAPCKLCHWRQACLRELERKDDLTLIPELGRAKRDSLASRIPTLAALAEINPGDYRSGSNRTVFPGIGPDTLRKFQQRARLVKSPDSAAFLTAQVLLPESELELFFDTEVDPLRDVCYLHGFIERRGRDPATERYVPFFAGDPTATAEERAFAEAWTYVQELGAHAIYFYSKYERTQWRKLQERCPSVCSETEVDDMFASSAAVDLYELVRSSSEWPTRDFSIKTLASYLGFSWRDAHPSGAASVEWYDRWVTTHDPEVRKRILEYNEDDCRATRVLLDGVRRLPVRVAPA